MDWWQSCVNRIFANLNKMGEWCSLRLLFFFANFMLPWMKLNVHRMKSMLRKHQDPKWGDILGYLHSALAAARISALFSMCIPQFVPVYSLVITSSPISLLCKVAGEKNNMPYIGQHILTAMAIIC